MSNEVLSCYYKIHINGVELDDNRKRFIESVSKEELDDRSDSCTIVISDPNFEFIEDNIFVEEATVYVEIGWYGYTDRDTFFGYISAIDITFPEDGIPKLSIFCMDNTHLMNRKKKTRSWDNVTRPDVVRKIAAEYGFKCVVQSGYKFTTESTISQSKNTDIEFIENLAREEREPFRCKLIGDTIYYEKKGLLSESKATFYYKKGDYDVVNFSPKINKETKQEEVESSDINTDTKLTDTAVATDSSTSRDIQGDPVQTSSSKTTESYYKYNTQTGEWDKKAGD